MYRVRDKVRRRGREGCKVHSHTVENCHHGTSHRVSQELRVVLLGDKDNDKNALIGPKNFVSHMMMTINDNYHGGAGIREKYGKQNKCKCFYLSLLIFSQNQVK